MRYSHRRTCAVPPCVRCGRVFALLLVLSLHAFHCFGQVSFTSVIALALQNSPRVKAATIDVQKAQAGLAVMKDIYIPSVTTGAGVGDAYGITLNVPTIFTVNAQSLVYSAQQHAYVRSAHDDLQASKLALDEARMQVEQDTAITYISLDNAQQVAATLAQQYDLASKLVSIVQDRVNSALDSELELLKARRGAVQIKLQQLQAADDLEATRAHLAQLTSLPLDQLMTAPESIPTLPSSASLSAMADGSFADSPGLLAAEANAKAKEERAQADAHYTWRPQISFGAQYGRISPINDVSNFYNLHGNYNTANIGIQIQLPLMDKVRKAAGHEALLTLRGRCLMSMVCDSTRMRDVANCSSLSLSFKKRLSSRILISTLHRTNCNRQRFSFTHRQGVHRSRPKRNRPHICRSVKSISNCWMRSCS